MERRNSSKDDDLFKEAMRDVTPVPPPKTVVTRPARPVTPSRLMHSPDEDENSADDEFNFRRPGIQISEFKKLRNGHIPLNGELDLHGQTSVEAERRLKAFLLAMQSSQGQRAVRVIHGKGLRSPDHVPVLKGKVAEWLRQANAVLAFCEAGHADGGSGALRVLLRRR